VIRGRELRVRAAPAALLAAALMLLLLAFVLSSSSLLLRLLAAVVAAGVVYAAVTELRAASRNPEGLGLDEIDRLRRAELALAAAPSTDIAARELGKHAM
jgi:hypothetical protein